VEGEEGRSDSTVRSKIADVYWFDDISIASALQSLRFILWRYEGGYGDDWNVPGLIVLLEQKGSVEPGDVRQLKYPSGSNQVAHYEHG
jgi:hypothetical protein